MSLAQTKTRRDSSRRNFKRRACAARKGRRRIEGRSDGIRQDGGLTTFRRISLKNFQITQTHQVAQRRIQFMALAQSSFWKRRIWWLAAAFGVAVTVSVGVLVAAAVLTSSAENGLLSAVILCALPWSLVLLMLDQAPGFAARAGFVVVGGVCLNLALLWFASLGVAAYRRRRQHQRPSKRLGT